MKRRHFLVRPGRRVRLDEWPTDHTHGVGAKADAVRLLAENIRAIADAQERLYAQDRWSLLVIFQALDAAGKDSTIKHVMSGVNPQGVHVTSFKAPSTLELDHDYLWRSVRALPERGMIGIHNRSYYEEVIVVRVHPELLERQRLPSEYGGDGLWRRRYRQIRHFESFLTENGTVVLKFFLHVSRDEQRKRFLERLDTPEKHWKFSLQDVREREHWRDYQRAYEDMLAETSTDEAPWYVIPADHKWYMQWAVGEILVDTLRRLDLQLPVMDKARRRELVEGRRLLAAERPRRRG
ncbi:MAG TPA: polyphosphate kinase 2 family protein [Vicinamibacterales bacterium]|jgi:PPK2 family polyphosphate:nucleotide phosphotransferase|nr:polyphosphate kinase 2 family protein [Vicinamibacterales bacterium]